MTRLRNYFLTGLIVCAPLAITAYIAWSFIGWVDSWVKPLIPARYSPDNYLPFSVPGFGLLVALVLITLLGFLTANFVGRAIVSFGEHLLDRMPLVRSIYSGAEADLRDGAVATRPTSFQQGRRWSNIRARACGRSSSSPASKEARSTPALDRASDPTVAVFMPITPNADDRLPDVSCRSRDVIDARHDGRGRGQADRSRPGWWRRNTSARSARAAQGGRAAVAATTAPTAADGSAALSPPAAAAPPRRGRTDRAAAAAPRRARDCRSGSRDSDQPRVVAGDLQQVGVRPRARDAEARHAGLARAEQLAFAAQPQILLGDAEAVLGLAHDRQPRASRSRRAAPCRAAGRSTACRRARRGRAAGAAAPGRSARHAR